MASHASARIIRFASLIIGIAMIFQVGFVLQTQVAVAQATAPPRSTPTLVDTPPSRPTPTPLDTPISNETPVRPTPTSSNEPPPLRATPTTVHSKPVSNPPEATETPTALPVLLPATGNVNRTDRYGSDLLAILTGLGLVCLGLGFSIRRWWQHRHIQL